MTTLYAPVDYDVEVDVAGYKYVCDCVSLSLLTVGSAGKGGERRAAIKYDIRSLPTDATVTSVYVRFGVTSAGGSNHELDVYPYNGDGQADPENDTAYQIWDRVRSGTPYINNSTAARTTGQKDMWLGLNADEDVEAARDAGTIFSLGFSEQGGDIDPCCRIQCDDDCNSDGYDSELKIVYSSGGQTHEINVDAIVKSQAEDKREATFEISKDASVSGQAQDSEQSTFNLAQESIAQALATKAITRELQLIVDAVVKASGAPDLAQTLQIQKSAVVKAAASRTEELIYQLLIQANTRGDASVEVESWFSVARSALVQALATVTVEKIGAAIIEIFKDAVVKSQAQIQFESTFNICKACETKARVLVGSDTIYSIVAEALTQAVASPNIQGVYLIEKDAMTSADSVLALRQTLQIPKNAVVVSASSPEIEATFNLTPDATVKVLAVLSFTKLAAEVIKVILIAGSLLFDLKGGWNVSLDLKGPKQSIELSNVKSVELVGGSDDVTLYANKGEIELD